MIVYNELFLKTLVYSNPLWFDIFQFVQRKEFPKNLKNHTIISDT